MPIEKLKTFLDKEGIKYVIITHSRAYTAQEAAASAHIPGREVAKTVMVKLDGRMAMAVLPASYHIDLEHLAGAAGAKKVSLASEHEFAALFPDCDTGAMPPFGNLYGLPVYVDERLTHDTWIAFNAGKHSVAIQMAFSDFRKLVEPTVVALAERAYRSPAAA